MKYMCRYNAEVVKIELCRQDPMSQGWVVFATFENTPSNEEMALSRLHDIQNKPSRVIETITVDEPTKGVRWR